MRANEAGKVRANAERRERELTNQRRHKERLSEITSLQLDFATDLTRQKLPRERRI